MKKLIFAFMFLMFISLALADTCVLNSQYARLEVYNCHSYSWENWHEQIYNISSKDNAGIVYFSSEFNENLKNSELYRHDVRSYNQTDANGTHIIDNSSWKDITSSIKKYNFSDGTKAFVGQSNFIINETKLFKLRYIPLTTSGKFNLTFFLNGVDNDCFKTNSCFKKGTLDPYWETTSVACISSENVTVFLPLNETSGTYARDWAGTEDNNATTISGTCEATANGRKNSGTCYMAIKSGQDLNLSDGVTWDMMIEINRTGGDSGAIFTGNNPAVFTKLGWSHGANTFISTYGSSDGASWNVISQTNNFMTITSAVWEHIGLSYNGTHYIWWNDGSILNAVAKINNVAYFDAPMFFRGLGANNYIATIKNFVVRKGSIFTSAERLNWFANHTFCQSAPVFTLGLFSPENNTIYNTTPVLFNFSVNDTSLSRISCNVTDNNNIINVSVNVTSPSFIKFSYAPSFNNHSFNVSCWGTYNFTSKNYVYSYIEIITSANVSTTATVEAITEIGNKMLYAILIFICVVAYFLSLIEFGNEGNSLFLKIVALISSALSFKFAPETLAMAGSVVLTFFLMVILIYFFIDVSKN